MQINMVTKHKNTILYLQLNILYNLIALRFIRIIAMSNTENEEKTFLIVASLGAIAGFILPLIMWVLKKEEFSDYTKKFLADILNFELLLLIISIGLGFVPFIRWLAAPILFILNLVVVLRCFSAIRERKEYNFPLYIQLVK